MALLPLGLQAADEEKKLSEWKFEDTVIGEKPTKSYLKGKVVVIEYWGVNWPPCIAGMPHLVKMDKRYRDKGLVIIGAESQNSSEDAIKKITDDAKVEFTITKGVSGPVQVSGIPVALIFDAKGKMIFQGHPSSDEFDKTVKSALKEVGETEEVAEEKKVVKKDKPLVAYRKWTNAEGKSLTASILKLEGEEITFQFRTGKVVKYQLGKLSEDGQKFIKLAAEERATADAAETAEEEE